MYTGTDVDLKWLSEGANVMGVSINEYLQEISQKTREM
jgi:hypothetical protein